MERGPIDNKLCKWAVNTWTWPFFKVYTGGEVEYRRVTFWAVLSDGANERSMTISPTK